VNPLIRLFVILSVPLLLAGCASLATQRLADNLSNAMLNQSDPETVRAGAPAYLLLLDSLIEDSPDDAQLLMAGARLYGAYGGGLVDDPQRAARLSSRSRQLARRALCADSTDLCQVLEQPFDTFKAAVDRAGEDHLQTIYTLATSWAGWIQTHSDDWNAVADLPRVDALLQRVIDLQPGYDRGRAQLYLAVMRSQLPPALGGKPEQGKQHFELAIRYSEGRDLMAKVEYARRYARLVFDQPLHDRLLQEVLKASPEAPGLTLSNVLAQQQARQLLDEEYF